MSKMAELSYDIEQLYIEGHSAKVIAIMLDCPIEIVLGALEEMGVADADKGKPWTFAEEWNEEEYDPFNTLNS
jgi:hypothetical protein